MLLLHYLFPWALPKKFDKHDAPGSNVKVSRCFECKKVGRPGVYLYGYLCE